MPRLGEEVYFSDTHKENIRIAALARGVRLGNHVSVMGVVYPNATRAEAATGFSYRTIIRRCESKDPRYKDYFRISKRR